MSSVTQKNPIRLFVAHAWLADEDYHRIFEYIESTPNFFYTNTSTPDQRPSGDRETLREALRKQIGDAEVVLVPASLYRRNMDWIEFQMHCAKAYDKPIIVLEPFGGAQTIPPPGPELADDVIPGEQRHRVEAINRQARHEETKRNDPKELKLD